MASVVYNSGIPLWPGIVSGATPSLVVKIALIKSSYTANKDHVNMTSFNTHEIAADPSYTRKTLTNITQTIDTVNDRVVYDADDLTWTELANAQAVRGVVIFVEEGVTEAERKLLAFFDNGTNILPNGTDFSVVWDSSGIVRFRQA
jgi:hypothetical protein